MSSKDSGAAIYLVGHSSIRHRLSVALRTELGKAGRASDVNSKRFIFRRAIVPVRDRWPTQEDNSELRALANRPSEKLRR
jgi:hypothetical protein